MNDHYNEMEVFMKLREDLQNRTFSNYEWDVDYLLMNETLLPCRMVLDQKECAFIASEKQNKETNEIVAGEILEIPMWIAKELHFRGFVEINYPEFISSRMANALRTDPCSVDLSSISSYFFEIGIILSNLFRDKMFLKILLDSFRSRLEKLYLISLYFQSPNPTEYSKLNDNQTEVFLKSLTSIEKDMLEESSINYFQFANIHYCKRRLIQ